MPRFSHAYPFRDRFVSPVHEVTDYSAFRADVPADALSVIGPYFGNHEISDTDHPILLPMQRTRDTPVRAPLTPRENSHNPCNF